MKWFFPAWNGDHRLETLDADRCKLIVIKPTNSEQALLAQFWGKVVKKGWAKGEDMQHGTYFLEDGVIQAPIGKVGPILMKTFRPGRAVLTAVKFEGGKIEVVESRDVKADVKLEAAVSTATAAATVNRPRLCCPACIEKPKDARAETVLRTFLSPRQLGEWQREHAFQVVGGTTGHVYEIAHRHSKRAVRRGRLVLDLDDGVILHCYDWTVPPAEEALACKLLLENRESWLRNEASLHDACNGRARQILKNPFGNYLDGADEDAPIAALIGYEWGKKILGSLRWQI